MVSGPQRGMVWADDSADDAGLRPLTDRGDRIGFARWYLNWLDEAAATAGRP
ncbi:hypothetical protein [Plantactinospora sp. B24E8]|uniref:hypothetical protein n=1 Tax=Plantactinospora sp. B24E8 TaxID=3153567 RepID=UPI00325CEFE6